jgi:hypothetical protein
LRLLGRIRAECEVDARVRQVGVTGRVRDPEFLNSRTPGDRVEDTVDLGRGHPRLLRNSNELGREHGLTDHVPRNQVVTLGGSGACVREARENGYEDG